MHPEERPVFALFMRLASAMMFSAMFLCVKLAQHKGAALPEVMFWRQGIAVLVLLAWLTPTSKLGLVKTHRIGPHVARSAVGMMGMVCSFTAVSLLPLAEATTIGFTAPLFAVLITAFVLRDLVGPWRWSAVAIGFLGVLLITRPGDLSLSPLGLAAGLGSALIVAIVSFQIRSLSKVDGPVAVVFYFSLFGALVTAPFLPFYIKAHDAETWLPLIGSGLAGALGQLFASLALRYGAVATVIIVDYTALIWATLFGFLVFDRLPPATTWIGAPVIIAAGLVVLWREHRLARLVPPASALEDD